jgi:hypothetical protein
VLRLYEGSVQALLKLYLAGVRKSARRLSEGSIKALLRLYEDSMKALFGGHAKVCVRL